MKQKLLLIAAVVLLALAGSNTAYGSVKESKAEKEARFVEQVKAGVQSLGTGESARVEVKLKDKSKISGYIREAGADAFTVVDIKTGAETLVPYNNTRQVKGNNLSTGAKVAIGLAILAGVLALLLFFENYG